jgi:hypothetical protein
MTDEPEREPLTSVVLNWRLILFCIAIGFLIPVACTMLMRR